MHANQMSLAQCRYPLRAMSASSSPSPSPPPIPPQPNRIQYKQQMYSIEVPPPPPRCYQLVPIRDNTSQASTQSPKLHSFGKSSFDRNSLRDRNNYENVRDIIKPPFVVKDPRRKPYYYNELSQNLDANETIENNNNNQITQLNAAINNESSDQFLSNNEIKRISDIKSNSASNPNYGSGGSLDHII